MTSAVAARIGGGAGFGVAGADFGQCGGEPAGRGDDEMPAAAGGVDDGEVEQRLLFVVLGWRAQGFGDERVEGFGEDDVDQFGGRVVGAGLLAFVAGGDGEGEGVVGGVVAGGVGQQPFVHAAELFAVEVAVVDRARGAGDRVVDLGQRFDRGEEGVVGQAGVVEDAEEVAAEQRGAQAGKPEGGQARAGQGVGDDLVGVPQVGVAAPGVGGGQVAQPGGGEVVGVAPAGRGGGVRRCAAGRGLRRRTG